MGNINNLCTASESVIAGQPGTVIQRETGRV